jgi:hypothetical protein
MAHGGSLKSVRLEAHRQRRSTSVSTAVNTLDQNAAGAFRGLIPALPGEPQVAPAVNNDRIDLKFLAGIFRRRSGLFVSVLGASLALGAVVTALQPRIYVAHADVTLNNKTVTIAPTSTNDRIADSQAPNDAFVDTQVAQVTWRSARCRDRNLAQASQCAAHRFDI